MPDQDKAREQFEAWYEPDEVDRAFVRRMRDGADYRYGLVHLLGSWQGWQAATAAASQDREELVEALQNIVKSLSEQDDEGLIEHAEPMQKARAAIRKATGESE
jgi:hypothetical protein